MTRCRVHGNDQPMMEWFRNNSRLDSDRGYVLTDVDAILHQYATDYYKPCDRSEQKIMGLEIKTRNGEPRSSQRDTLFKLHQFRGKCEVDGNTVFHLGWYFLMMSGEWPDKSERLRWGVFSDSGQIKWHDITYHDLNEIFEFRRHPAMPLGLED